MSTPSMKMRPAVGRSKPAITAQRRLAAARRAEQAEDLLLEDAERDVVDGDEIAELLGDPLDAHVRLGVGIVPGLELQLRVAR
jgi:hypothetical protein